MGSESEEEEKNTLCERGAPVQADFKKLALIFQGLLQIFLYWEDFLIALSWALTQSIFLWWIKFQMKGVNTIMALKFFVHSFC